MNIGFHQAHVNAAARKHDDIHPVERTVFRKPAPGLGAFLIKSEKIDDGLKQVVETDDHTEITASESEYSDSLNGSSWHSRGYGRSTASQQTLRVAAHAVHETRQDIQFEKLKHHHILGEGFFGEVWLVSDENEAYAIKKISKYHLLVEDQVEAVSREKSILMQLHHPGIVPLLAVYQDEASLFFLQPFLQGGELFSLIHGKTEITESACQFYTACITDAIWYMHEQNILYRDLKPENVLIDNTGYPILIDLGHAKVLDGTASKTYTLCGTPKYLPPEMVEGAGHTFSADYWSLGVVLYEMITGGDHPFEFWKEMDELSLYAAIAESEYLDLPETVSPIAADIIDHMLMKDPLERLGSNESESLNQILEHEWLSAIDIPALRRKLVSPPWVPAKSDRLDSTHFQVVPEEDDSLNETAFLTLSEQARFADFDSSLTELEVAEDDFKM